MVAVLAEAAILVAVEAADVLPLEGRTCRRWHEMIRSGMSFTLRAVVPLAFVLGCTLAGSTTSVRAPAAVATASATQPRTRPPPRITLKEIDLAKATIYLREFDALCAADGGKMWGASLCGPLMFVDPTRREVVSNRRDRDGYLSPTDDESVFIGLYRGRRNDSRGRGVGVALDGPDEGRPRCGRSARRRTRRRAECTRRPIFLVRRRHASNAARALEPTTASRLSARVVRDKRASTLQSTR
jgi:hypothetical protein